MSLIPITQTITSVENIPDRSVMDQETFDLNATLFANQIQGLATDLGPWGDQANALASAINVLVGILSSGTYGAIDFLRLTASPGDILFTAKATPPVGTLKANGAAVAVATYSDLATAIYCGDAMNATALWGYRCTGSDGSGRSTTGAYIVIPDLRGEFIRGWDDSRGVDSARVFGSAQADAFKSHVHSHRPYFGIGASAPTVDGTAVCGSSWAGAGGFFNSFPPTDTAATGGTETRPRNIALLACIKY